MSAELSALARRTAAAAGEFQAALTAFARGGPRPDYVAWALRLEQHLRYVLEAPGPDGQAAARLADITLLLEVFDWPTDDPWFALEQIDDIASGRQP